jgi:ketosteroid isomerase-like protein
MDVSRRDVVVAGAFALGASSLLLGSSASAQVGDEAAVAQNVEILRKAWQQADRSGLDQVTSEQVSYGHSDGRVENKEQFIQNVMARKQVVKSLTFPDLKLFVVGNAAVVRHIFLSESEQDGKATTTRIGVVQVWQKQDGNWKLLARQGFRLPA